MLLRTVVLLALCVSSGMCATLGYYQTQEPEEGVPTVDSAVASVDDAAKDGVNAEVAKEEGTLLAKILTANNQGDSKPVDVQVADDAKKPEADSHGTKEAVAQNQPSSEEEANEIRPVQKNESLNRPLAREDKTNSWGLDSIRSSFQTVHGYFDSLVELVGGPDGVCQYRCRYGELPQPRPGYNTPKPNGCSSSLVGVQVIAALDLGIPAMTQCCNNLDICYDTCGTSKYDCDSEFRTCLHGICSDLKKSLGFVSRVQACESMADGLYNTVWALGCRPYMNSQRAACVCEGEERDEL